MAEENRVCSQDDTIMSGEVVADSLEPQVIAELENDLPCRLLKVGLEDMGKKLTPKQSLDLLKAKLAEGHPVDGLLDQRVSLVYNESRNRSMGRTASAVRNWHGFAWHIKGYNPEATLPPRNEREVAQWMCLFRNYGTAMNYLCSLKWTCVKHELDVDWYGPFLKTLMKRVEEVEYEDDRGRD